MDRSPPVSLGGAAEDLIDSGERAGGAGDRARWLGLGVAAVVGFAAAHAFSWPADDPGASLALVVGRQPYVSATDGDAPETTLEVTLVNTGTSAVRLEGAAVAGSELTWEADRPLKPGEQVSAVLREQRPCRRASDVLSRGGAAGRTLQVRLDGAGNRADGPVQSLTMPPAVGRLYDDHVRDVCKLPRLPNALDVVQGASTVEGDELVVALGLLNLSVRPLQVVEVAGALPGLSRTLTDAAGRPLALPVDVPARTRSEISQGVDYDAPATTPYRLRLSATPQACAALRTATGGDGSMEVFYIDAEEPRSVATRQVFPDLAQLVRQTCT